MATTNQKIHGAHAATPAWAPWDGNAMVKLHSNEHGSR
jgi:hypothetical protein